MGAISGSRFQGGVQPLRLPPSALGSGPVWRDPYLRGPTGSLLPQPDTLSSRPIRIVAVVRALSPLPRVTRAPVSHLRSVSLSCVRVASCRCRAQSSARFSAQLQSLLHTILAASS